MIRMKTSTLSIGKRLESLKTLVEFGEQMHCSSTYEDLANNLSVPKHVSEAQFPLFTATFNTIIAMHAKNVPWYAGYVMKLFKRVDLLR